MQMLTYLLTYLNFKISLFLEKGHKFILQINLPGLGARITGGVNYFRRGATSKYACQNICCEKILFYCCDYVVNYNSKHHRTVSPVISRHTPKHGTPTTPTSVPLRRVKYPLFWDPTGLSPREDKPQLITSSFASSQWRLSSAGLPTPS